MEMIKDDVRRNLRQHMDSLLRECAEAISKNFK